MNEGEEVVFNPEIDVMRNEQFTIPPTPINKLWILKIIMETQTSAMKTSIDFLPKSKQYELKNIEKKSEPPLPNTYWIPGGNLCHKDPQLPLPGAKNKKNIWTRKLTIFIRKQNRCHYQ